MQSEMESQVLVCSADVAAFVDALETIGYPVIDNHPVTIVEEPGNEVEETDGEAIQEATYIIENSDISEEQKPAQTPLKRYRMNPKQQKEVIESLFEKQKAVVTEKAFMNLKGNKRFKSDVWSWFGDIKLLISRSEAKKLKIPYYFRMCGDERMMLSKLFVGCFRCNALFIHNSQRSGTSTLRAHMRVCSRPRPRKKKGAPTIIFFPTKGVRQATRIASENDKLLAQEHMLDFVLSTESSFDIIEDNEFRKLLQMCITIGANHGDVNVESMLCPQEKLSEFLLNDLYVTCMNSFYTEFQYSYGATFTLDVWMDEQQNGTYISVVCHYANSGGELKSIILHTEEFNCESKTPEDAHETFTAVLSEMAVVPMKRLVVSDNMSNTLLAFKDEECIRCINQNLNLALQNVVQRSLDTSQNEYNEFISLVSSCKDIVIYFEQISLQYQLPEPLKIGKEESWTSIIAMFRSIHNQYEDILNILNDTGETHLLSVEKAIIGAIVELFQVFEESQLELTSSTEPTLNLVIPLITKLRKHCLNFSSDFPLVQQLKGMITAEVNDRLSNSLSVYHRVATMLDPRYKRLVFSPREDQAAANLKAKCLVKECMDAPVIDDFNDRYASDGVSRDRFSDLYPSNVSCDSGSSEKSAHREVDNYLIEPFSTANQDLDQQQKFNPIKFWTQNMDKYPNLSKVALWVLSCPATCVQKQSLWRGEWLVNRCRIHQKPEYVNKVLFVKSFKRL